MSEEAEENRDDEAEAPDIFGRPTVTPPVDRASESSLAPPSVPPPKQTTAISSGPFEVAPSSLVPNTEIHAASPVSLAPSSQEALLPVSIASAMGRGRDIVPLSRIIGIGAAIFLVLVGLSLLLFR